MFFAIPTITLTLLLIATVFDLRTREIPDWISIVIGSVAALAAAVGWLGIGLLWVVAGGGVGLAIGYLLFRYAKLGGGDAKLIAALGLLVGPLGLLIVLLGMGVAGGVLSLVALSRGQRDFAYAPAIAAGFLGYVGLVSQF